MSKLSDKFLYYLFIINGDLKAVPPSHKAIYEPTGDIFFLVNRGSTREPTDSTFYLKER